VPEKFAVVGGREKLMGGLRGWARGESAAGSLKKRGHNKGYIHTEKDRKTGEIGLERVVFGQRRPKSTKRRTRGPLKSCKRGEEGRKNKKVPKKKKCWQANQGKKGTGGTKKGNQRSLKP